MTDHVKNLEALAERTTRDTGTDRLLAYAAALHAYALAMPWLVEADAARAAAAEAAEEEAAFQAWQERLDKFHAGGGPEA